MGRQLFSCRYISVSSKATMVRMCMTSPLLRSKIAILKKCHIWHHSKKCHIQGVSPILSWKHPVKQLQVTTKSADKKTETEKNRADTILVFILQHTSEYRIIFYTCPSFFLLLQSTQSPNSRLRKNNNSRVLLLCQIM